VHRQSPTFDQLAVKGNLLAYADRVHDALLVKKVGTDCPRRRSLPALRSRTAAQERKRGLRRAPLSTFFSAAGAEPPADSRSCSCRSFRGARSGCHPDSATRVSCARSQGKCAVATGVFSPASAASSRQTAAPQSSPSCTPLSCARAVRPKFLAHSAPRSERIFSARSPVSSSRY